MEYWGSNVISSAVHHPISGNLSIDEYVANYQYKAGVTSDFHIYAVEWNNERITLSVDGINHLNYEPLIKNQYTWPFDAEQFILLNIAITPNISNAFVQSSMEVDYVRVYQQGSLAIANTTKSKDLLLFPNPTTDKLNLKIQDNLIGSQITIYSILGQELNSYILNTEETNLDVSHYQNGIYLLKIYTNSGIQTYKIIKE
jgi:beta-glucanase (GH16 family)